MNGVIRPLNNCATCSHWDHCYKPDPTFCHSWEPDEAECKRILGAYEKKGVNND